MYYVYILRDKESGKFYIGQTNNLKDRIKRHNEGRSKYTKGKEWELYYFEEYETRSEAIKEKKKLN